MGNINSRMKGASSEREFAGLIRDNLGVKLVRVLDQSRGGGFDLAPAPNQEGPVVDALRGMAIECKRYGAITPHLMTRFWAQAVKQAEAAGLVPALAWRADRQPWRVTVPLSWLAGMGESREIEYAVTLSVEGFALAVRELAGGGTDEG